MHIYVIGVFLILTILSVSIDGFNKTLSTRTLDAAYVLLILITINVFRLSSASQYVLIGLISVIYISSLRFGLKNVK
jgi:hypothetical protein